jgi:hypothetical protein
VHWIEAEKKWKAVLSNNGTRYRMGSFEIEQDAAKAVDLKCQELDIPLKNSGVGVLNNDETLKKLAKEEKKVNHFYFNICNYILFWKRPIVESPPHGPAF